MDEQKLLDNARKLPASEQLSHKNWKVRQQLYDTIKEACTRASSTEDADISQYGALRPSCSHQLAHLVSLPASTGNLFAKAVADSNAAAQDRALEALGAYLAIADECTAATCAAGCFSQPILFSCTPPRVADTCCHHIVGKALKGRASTVKLSSDVFITLVELEQQAPVVVRFRSCVTAHNMFATPCRAGGTHQGAR